MTRRTSATTLMAATTLALALTAGCTQTTPPADPAGAATPEVGVPTSSPEAGDIDAGTTSEAVGAETADDSDATSGPQAADPSAGPVREVPAPEGLPDQLVDTEQAWSVDGWLLGTVGDVAVFQPSVTDSTQLRGIRADGSVAWEIMPSLPGQIAPGTELAPSARQGLDTIIVLWSGKSLDTSSGVVAVSILDPATGEETAAGSVEVELGAEIMAEHSISLDEFVIQVPQGYQALTVDTETGDLTVTKTATPPAHQVPVTSELAVHLDDHGRVQLITDDGPRGAGRECQPRPPGPGQAYLADVSANGRYVFTQNAVVDLTTGGVSCLVLRSGDVLIGMTDDGEVLRFRWEQDGAQPVAVLGDVVIFDVRIDEGFSAHRLL